MKKTMTAIKSIALTLLLGVANSCSSPEEMIDPNFRKATKTEIEQLKMLSAERSPSNTRMPEPGEAFTPLDYNNALVYNNAINTNKQVFVVPRVGEPTTATLKHTTQFVYQGNTFKGWVYTETRKLSNTKWNVKYYDEMGLLGGWDVEKVGTNNWSIIKRAWGAPRNPMDCGNYTLNCLDVIYTQNGWASVAAAWVSAIDYRIFGVAIVTCGTLCIAGAP